MPLSPPYPSTLPPITLSKTFVKPGPVNIASGGTDYLPPWIVTIPSGYSGSLTGVRCLCRTGTVNFKITRNAVDVTGLTALSATQAVSTTTVSQALTDGDVLAVVVTGIATAPDGLSVELKVFLS